MSLDREKLARLDDYLAAESVDSVWFARPGNFAWLTGGDNGVDRTNQLGAAAAGYDGQQVRVVTSNNERARFEAEELPSDVTVDAAEWHEASLADLVGDAASGQVAADFDVPGSADVDPSRFRWPLTDDEIDRYRNLSVQTTEAVEAAVRDATPETTENQGAAVLAQELLSRGLHAPVLLVGGDDRAQRHRHFTPTDTPLGDYAVYTVVAERAGLHVAVTRTVAFDAPEWLQARHDAAGRVAATAVAATAEEAHEGGTAGDVFTVIQESYAAVDEPGEWREHHQGGAIGYGSREWIATPDASMPVSRPMTYAWNPTVRGAKAEDTVLVTDDEVEVLTVTGDWPTTEYSSTAHDRTVTGHDILHR
jgi:Xaa-Pro aminopeptidase